MWTLRGSRGGAHEHGCAHAQELTTDRERADNLAARELATTKREAEQTISGLQQTVEELTDRLEALTEFKEKKDEIEARLAKCLAELESEREMRQAQVAELERRNVAAKDKLKKEMFVKIKETKQVRAAVAAAVVVRGHHPPSSVAEHLGKHQRPVGCGYQTHHGRERANDDGAAVPKQGNGEAAREKREADRGERRVAP